MTHSTLKARLLEDIKTAMRQQEKRRLTTLRLASAAIKQREVDEKITLTDDDVLVVLNKMIKQRRESIRQYQQGKRDDLAGQEQAEIDILMPYLPQPLSEAALSSILDAVFAQTGASTLKDMGAVMGMLKPQVQGRVDMSVLSAMVRQRLS